MRIPTLTCLFLLIVTRCCFAEKVAITFDDLPLNGTLPHGVNEVAIARATLDILKRERVLEVFGFINAKKLEGNPDGERALQLWIAAGQRLGNHAYSHPDLSKTDAGLFTADIERNEAVLRRLSAKQDWRWFRYPFLHEGEILATILRDLLALLKEKGLTLATLEEVQADDAYKVDSNAASRFGGTLLEQQLDARKIPYPTAEKNPSKELDALCR